MWSSSTLEVTYQGQIHEKSLENDKNSLDVTSGKITFSIFFWGAE